MMKPEIQPLSSDGFDPVDAVRTKRPVCFAETKEFVETTVYNGPRLRPGNRIDGPAVIEEPLTTVAVPPGFQCEVDVFGNYIMQVPSD